MAKQLLEAAGMDTEQEVHDRSDLARLASHIHEYQIKLWTCNGRQPVAYIDAEYNPEGTKFIGLFFYDGHYEVVDHIRGKKGAQ